MAAGVIGYIGRLRPAEGNDADLLRAYARGRDADAFAALVRRHGGRVWATCRRVAGDPHAAEDAFQATFLVLARKAGGLSAARPLGGWLHAVAVNVSVRARTAAARRRRREVAEVDAAAPAPPDPPDERALAALDEEVERLPAKLRDAVVLCELDGLSRKDAAAKLGVAEGTLSSRLAAARKRLAERLTDRGVRPELLAVPAAVPAGLAAAACGPPSAAVVALTGGTMRALLLKGLAAGAVAGGLLAVGGIAQEPPKPAELPVVVKPAAEPPPAKPVAEPAAVPRGLLVEGLWVDRRRKGLLTEAGAVEPMVEFHAYPARSPDGVWVASSKVDPRSLISGDRPTKYQIEVRRTDGTGEPLLVPPHPAGPGYLVARWDGNGAVLVRHIEAKAVARFDLAAKTLTPVPLPAADPPPPLPAGRQVAGAVLPSPDGKRLLFADRRAGGAAFPTDTRLCVLDRAAGTLAVLATASVVLEFGEPVNDGDPVAPGSPVRVYFQPAGGATNTYRSITRAGTEVGGYCWAPDGKRVAYDRRQVRGEVGKGDVTLGSAVWVCDPAGGNPAELYRSTDSRLRVIDWR